MASKKKLAIILPIAVMSIIALLVFGNKGQSNTVFYKNSGFIFGTSYNITYQSDKDLHDDIKNVMNSVDASLSPYNEKSIITAINNNKDIRLDNFFVEVFTLAQQVSTNTDGAFDITVAPLVNVWGFGFKKGDWPTDKDIADIKTYVGYEKVSITDTNDLSKAKITKQNPRTMLDCSAIAKGYAVDKVAEMLSNKGITNYLVEIGGEIVAHGTNPNGKKWSIGVTQPTDDSLSINNELQTILELSDIAMATSGDYRKYYIKDGHKYAHTINPKTGYPAEQDILSATVLAATCAEADAYATAFMTMGLEKTKRFLDTPIGKKLKVYLISNGEGKNKVWQRM